MANKDPTLKERALFLFSPKKANDAYNRRLREAEEKPASGSGGKPGKAPARMSYGNHGASQTLNSMRVPDQSIPGVFKDVVSQSTSLCHAGDTIIPDTPDETLLWAAAALAVLAAVAGFAAKKFFANRRAPNPASPI